MKEKTNYIIITIKSNEEGKYRLACEPMQAHNITKLWEISFIVL